MSLKLWRTDGRLGPSYIDITFEDLAEHVHEMAAVAWDRDSPEILLQHELKDELRFLVNQNGASAHTDVGLGTCIAIWDANALAWRPNGRRKLTASKLSDAAEGAVVSDKTTWFDKRE